jgi:hypothetical protein
MQIGDRVEVWSQAAGRLIEGVVVKLNGEWLVSWERNAGPIVPLQRLYPAGGDEWACKQRRRTYQNQYRKEKRRKLRQAIAESGQISLMKQKGAA